MFVAQTGVLQRSVQAAATRPMRQHTQFIVYTRRDALLALSGTRTSERVHHDLQQVACWWFDVTKGLLETVHV